jgi:asparagine synthase (glutamine-hydrolysing)
MKLPFSLLGMDSASEIFYNRMMVSGAQHWKRKILRQTGANKPYFFIQSAERESQLVGATELMGLMRKMEFDLHLQRVLLKVDRASMYHSLEVRVPLLSNAMLGASSGYPFKLCYSQGTGKLPLRMLMKRYVGQELASLPKRGFVVPIGQWIRGRFKQNFYEKILDMPKQLAPFFNGKQMEQLLKEHCNSSYDWSWIIWSLYTLSSWYQHHAKGRS